MKETFSTKLYLTVTLLLTAELLDVFRGAVVALQGRAAAAASPPPLAGLRHQLAEWQTLLPLLHGLLFDHGGGIAAAALPASAAEPVARGLAAGGRLVAAVRDAAARCGAPPLAAVLRRLAWHTDQTLFRQLSAWFVFWSRSYSVIWSLDCTCNEF